MTTQTESGLTTERGAVAEADVRPVVSYCPYCGADAIRHIKGAPRCDARRAVFFASFSRRVRLRHKS